MIFEYLPDSYAKAILELTKGQEEQTLSILRTIDTIIKQDKTIENFFLNPAVSRNLKIDLIKKIFSHVIPEVLVNFLCVLAKNERLDLLPEVIEIYQYYYDLENNIIPVKIITAIELDDEIKSLIENQLTKYFNKKLDLTYVVKPSIIGGIVIQSQGYEIDDSILTKLNHIYKNLKNTKLTGVVYED